MYSFDSTEAYVNRSPASQEMPPSSAETSSASAESSSDSGNTVKISTTPSIKPQGKSSPDSIRDNISTPSKPSTSIKRPREPQGKEVSKQPSKKSKKPVQDDKGKAAGVSEAEKSAKKNGMIWNAKNEVAFLKRLVVFCEKGNGLPKNWAVFYEAVKNDLDGDYSNDQLYNKVRSLRAKFGVARDKIKDKGFVGFKNEHEESLYKLSKQVWGNREEEEGCSEKAGKGDSARGEKKKKKKKKNIVDNEGEKQEVKRKKNGDVGMALNEQKEEEEVEKKDVKRKKNGDVGMTLNEQEEEEDVEKKEVKRKKNGDVGMALKEQEEEEAEEEDEEEDENDDEEGGRHDQDEQNVNVNLSQQDTLKEVKTMKRKEDGPSHIASTGIQRSEVRRGEKEVSSEEDVGEEQDSSDEYEESESESTDNEDSALADTNAAVELYKPNIGGSSTARNLNSALKQTNGGENSANHVSNGVSKGSRRVGTAGHYDAGENSRQHVVERLSDRRKVAAVGHHEAAENLAHHVSNGTANGSLRMTDQYKMFDQLCKDTRKIFHGQVKDMLDGLKNEILNIVDTVKKDLQGPSSTARATGFDFSITKGFSFGRELPSLSKTEAEMIDRKWQIQQFIEMEAASKHIALLQEEYQLRLAKFRHQ